MKLRTTLFCTALTILMAGNAQAQIKDDESSTNLLAMQCSMSSGLPTSNYEEYCRKLAKTVGLLNPSQQQRVFGYLPRPGAISAGEFPNYVPGSDESNSFPANDAAQSNPLVAWVGDLNETLDGKEEKSGSIIGGEPPASENSEEAQNEDTSGNDKYSWWGGILDWVDRLINKAKQDGAL